MEIARKKVSEVTITGQQRTKPYVLYRELGFSVGDQVSRQDIDLGISNLRNTNLFSKVSYEVEEDNNGFKIQVEVDERWTTIPVLKFTSGGGVTQTTVGIYDPNVLGHFIEMGGQVEKIEDVISGVVWFKDPRLFDKRLGIDFQFWDTNRIRTKYDQDTDELKITNGFLKSSQKLILKFTKEFRPDLVANAAIEYDKDTFSDRFLNDELKSILASKGLPPDTEFRFVGLGVLYGRVNHNSYLIDGMDVGLSVKYASSATQNVDDFVQTDFSFRYYKTLWSKWTFAQRILAGATSTNVIQYWYYLGGLDRIRGYTDNRFAGRNYILSNTELRWAAVDKPNYVIQGTTFVDLLESGENFSDLDSLKGASLGLGIRIILPKFYRMALRFDAATRFVRDDEKGFSFGVQQFF